MPDRAEPSRLIIVTGPSGAGRSTAIRALEDMGYEAIDNLPLSLIPRLTDGPALERPMALGVDARNRDFSTSGLLELIDGWERDETVAASTLYLDASDDVLVRRFSETRRRHPLSPAGQVAEGVMAEKALLSALRTKADILIDTSALSPHDLKAEIERWYAQPDGKPLSVSVQSFSYKRGLPRGLDMVFDCRFLRNPHWDAQLRARDGRDPDVADYVRDDPRFEIFFTQVSELIEMLLPAFVQEGKSYLSIGFGCSGGKHRSVALTELLAKTLANNGWQVSKRHRELERVTVPLRQETQGTMG